MNGVQQRRRGVGHVSRARVLRPVLGVGLALLVAVVALVASGCTRSSVRTESLILRGGPTSGTDPTPVQLDTDVYLPATTPAPAVLLAHGFGGNKGSVAAEARLLADAGFVVLAYTARGFGNSTGLISMNSPQFEVADASALIDYLSGLPTVSTQGPGDPIVGVAGGSYGGALALLLAGLDDRVDAVAADITWNDLSASLFGQSALGSDVPGVYKELWTSAFFSAGLASPQGQADLCGRFAPQWCAAYTAAAASGAASEELRVLMRASSPASVTDRIKVPTLLGGGQADSLFPLAQLNATAEQIRAANPDTPVKVVWHGQGHDGGADESSRLRGLTRSWFAAYLADGPPVALDFEASLVEVSALDDRESANVDILTSPGYPGLSGETRRSITLAGPPQRILAPAGGVPAAVTSLPGLGSLGTVLSLLDVQLAPNQGAAFFSEPLSESTRIIGAPRVSLEVSSDIPRDATLFVGLRIQTAAETFVLPNGLVAPMKVEVGPTPRRVDVELPAIVADAAAGNRLIVTVSTTDQAYRLPVDPSLYTVSLADSTLTIPQVAMTETAQGLPLWAWPLIALCIAVAMGLVLRMLRPRSTDRALRPDLADSPLVIEGLVKQFRSGVRAVAGVDFTVPRGVVLGLLGPNGAGKTTTMRMAMGLIRPTDGSVFVFGERVIPGAPVLSRVGTFIEGPGFLPHLSGRANLELFWRASGRSGDPLMDDVLEIAGLGASIDRKVRTYSQGMRQRLGLAQAMLGLPDILILDEPTNGLDPPQIREMRQVLREYAKDGRTVILSSHLLGEVEQTCSHVVVMHRGTVVTAGKVEELLADRSGQQLEDVFMDLVGSDHLANAGPLEETRR
ncbi:MAG: alpha/beta fold hydrolase [Acidimicrobiia bacterium]|nr:alpha/beta fold hydrolase [Acidimicrobiia bacterium]